MSAKKTVFVDGHGSVSETSVAWPPQLCPDVIGNIIYVEYHAMTPNAICQKLDDTLHMNTEMSDYKLLAMLIRLRVIYEKPFDHVRCLQCPSWITPFAWTAPPRTQLHDQISPETYHKLH